MKVEDGRIVLHLDTWLRELDDAGIQGFAIAGEDRKFQPADANWLVKGKDRHNRPQYDRRAVVLTSKHVAKPIHFRYAWGRNPMGNLVRADHTTVPLATQRSDNWAQEEVPEKFFADKSATPRDYSRRLNHQARKALRLADMERRLKEARAFIDENAEKYEKDKASWEKEKARNKERYENAGK